MQKLYKEFLYFLLNPDVMSNMLFSCSIVSDSSATPLIAACLAPLFMRRILESVAIFFSKGSFIFPTQGLNSRPLHWQVDSLPLSHLESSISNMT